MKFKTYNALICAFFYMKEANALAAGDICYTVSDTPDPSTKKTCDEGLMCAENIYKEDPNHTTDEEREAGKVNVCVPYTYCTCKCDSRWSKSTTDNYQITKNTACTVSSTQEILEFDTACPNGLDSEC